MSETWMIDGKPGQIIALAVKCALEVGDVETTVKGQGDERMTYRSAEAIKRAARVLARNGVATEWESSEDNSPVKAFGEIRITAKLIAPDGSFMVHSIKAAAYAGRGRHYTVATTAAVKQILSLALQMATDDQEDEEPPPAPDPETYSENLQSILLAQKQAITITELQSTNQLLPYSLLSNAERMVADREANQGYNLLVRRLEAAKHLDPKGRNG